MIYLFLADGFEECEALVPLDILRRADIEVETVGIGGCNITGAHGITVKTDTLDDNIHFDGNFEGIILPGGMPGTINLENSKLVAYSIDIADKWNKLICAICAAPKILGNMGLLKGKKATCFPGFENELLGADVKPFGVVKDGNIITAKGAGVAYEFGFEIVSAIKDKETADNLKLQMQCVSEV